MMDGRFDQHFLEVFAKADSTQDNHLDTRDPTAWIATAFAVLAGVIGLSLRILA